MKKVMHRYNIAKTISYRLAISYIFIIAFSVLLFESCENKISHNINDSIKTVNPDLLSPADSINYAFNYSQNHKIWQMTFLEFGSTGCIECKRMEGVMDSVQEVFNNKVNVVFYNVRNNKKMTKHFGVNLIPVQILLNKQGKECFRHVGYYSFDELSEEIQKK